MVTLLIDGRGSAYEGDNFMHSTYKQLGYIEPIDQIAVTRHVLGKLQGLLLDLPHRQV